MEQSPLELYETAYKLQYIGKKISDALLYYKRIIENFPESNECGYASIQIQKIKAENLAGELNKAGKILHPISMIAFLSGILSLLLSISFGLLLSKRLNIENKRSLLTLNALGELYSGDHDEALKSLSELKKITNNIIPVKLIASVLKKKQNYRLAREEYELFFKLNPDLNPSGSEVDEMKNLDEIIISSENKKKSTKRAENKKSNDIAKSYSYKKKDSNLLKKTEGKPNNRKDSVSYY